MCQFSLEDIFGVCQVHAMCSSDMGMSEGLTLLEMKTKMKRWNAEGGAPSIGAYTCTAENLFQDLALLQQ